MREIDMDSKASVMLRDSLMLRHLQQARPAPPVTINTAELVELKQTATAHKCQFMLRLFAVNTRHVAANRHSLDNSGNRD